MRISSYSFILILLKLHRCFGHGLKICMWFGYNPQIIFYHFFCYFNLGILKINNNGGGHKFSEFACFISDFDLVCGRLYGLIRAYMSDSLAFKVDVPFKSGRGLMYCLALRHALVY